MRVGATQDCAAAAIWLDAAPNVAVEASCCLLVAAISVAVELRRIPACLTLPTSEFRLASIVYIERINWPVSSGLVDWVMG